MKGHVEGRRVVLKRKCNKEEKPLILVRFKWLKTIPPREFIHASLKLLLLILSEINEILD